MAHLTVSDVEPKPMLIIVTGVHDLDAYLHSQLLLAVSMSYPLVLTF